jgi:DNA (cytosine-5)-methyltransferase 1
VARLRRVSKGHTQGRARTMVAPSMHDQPLHLQVLAYVQESPGATYQELAGNFQVKLRSARGAVRRLEAAKLVRVTLRNQRAEVKPLHPAVWEAQDDDPLTLHAADLFCGVGGFSQGFAQACERLGRDLNLHVDLVGINHDEEAIQGWRSNHPWGRWCREDITKAQPRRLFPGGRLRLLLASPSCTHHSTARGGLPVSDQLRSQPWQAVRWARDLDIDTIIVENVPEIRSWGPTRIEACGCIRDGRPDKACRHCKGGGSVEVAIKDGSIFRKWIREFQLLGYTINYDTDGQPGQILNAADYGDATSRRRFFLIAKKGTSPVPVPRQTHSKGGQVPGTKPWRSAREVIDFTLPSRSIFDRKKPLAKKTLRRMFDGLERRNGDWIKPFLAALRDRHDVEPPKAQKVRKGGRSRKPQPVVLGQQSGGAPRSVDEPLPTVAGGGAISLAQPSVVQLTHGGREHDVDSPLPTITTANRGELGLAEATLQPVVIPPDGPGGNGEHNHAKALDEPLSTVRASRGDRFGLAEPVLTQYNGTGGAPSIDHPLPAATTRDRFGLAEPTLVDMLGSKDNWQARNKGLDEPLLSNHAGGVRTGLAEPVVMTLDRPETNRSLAHGVDQPIATVVANNVRIAVITPELRPESVIVPNFGERSGQAARHHPLDEPVPTVTSHGAGVLAQPSLSPAPGKVSWWRGRPVIDGWMLDILFRMLTYRELAAAMGFPEWFRFAKTIRQAIKQIGNAVAVNMAEALVMAALQPARGVNLHSFDETAEVIG